MRIEMMSMVLRIKPVWISVSRGSDVAPDAAVSPGLLAADA